MILKTLCFVLVFYWEAYNTSKSKSLLETLDKRYRLEELRILLPICNMKNYTSFQVVFMIQKLYVSQTRGERSI